MQPLPTPIGTDRQARPQVGLAGRLPRPMTSFLGRHDELDAICTLLADPDRLLVTLIGPGGIGKTRLANEAARLSVDWFDDGLVFVGLADVRDPALLLTTIAHALGVHDAIGTALLDRIRDVYRGARLLLVVDNLEHLVEATPVLSSIVSLCPGITVLATSRRRLGLACERVFDVTPLPLDLAISLFEQRAQAIAPDFRTTTELEGVIADICSELDGLPLAIELAAARVPVLPPEAIRDRLDNRLSLLGEGPRDGPDRHRGMREAIGWSYDLLSGNEQQLFRRLAVFEGGFTFDAAAAISDPGEDVLANLTALEASSLVRLRPAASGPHRFRMLETVREYALERLLELGEERLTRDMHARYVVTIAGDTEFLWWQSGGLDKLDEMNLEIPNIRAALAWLKEIGDVPQYLRLAGALAPVWGNRGYGPEGQAILEWGLAWSDGAEAIHVVVALRALSWTLNHLEVPYRSLLVAQHALALAEDVGSSRDRALSLLLSGIAANGLDIPEWSIVLFTAATEVLDQHEDEPWSLGTQTVAMNLTASVLYEQGEIDRAEAMWVTIQKTVAAHDVHLPVSGYVLSGLGLVARARGNHHRALELFLSGLRIARTHNEIGIGHYLCSIGGTLSALGHFETAGMLFGASEACHRRFAIPFEPAFAFQRALGLPEPWASMYPEFTVAEGLRLALVDQTAAIRSITLDASVSQAWWDQGRRLDVDAAVDLVFDLVVESPPIETLPGGLSMREGEVLRLLAEGRSDREIAALLFISPRTVQNHIQHIYHKIEVSSRSAATNWAFRHGLAGP